MSQLSEDSLLNIEDEADTTLMMILYEAAGERYTLLIANDLYASAA
jgi:hypothetical protein